jgi:hypothetical protein
MPAAKTSRVASVYIWSPEEGKSVTLGEVRSYSSKPAGAVHHVTESHATAKLWARELAAGRIPSWNARERT